LTFFDQLKVSRILHVTTKCHDYITVAQVTNLVAQYGSIGKKTN